MTTQENLYDIRVEKDILNKTQEKHKHKEIINVYIKIKNFLSSKTK